MADEYRRSASSVPNVTPYRTKADKQTRARLSRQCSLGVSGRSEQASRWGNSRTSTQGSGV